MSWSGSTRRSAPRSRRCARAKRPRPDPSCRLALGLRQTRLGFLVATAAFGTRALALRCRCAVSRLAGAACLVGAVVMRRSRACRGRCAPLVTRLGATAAARAATTAAVAGAMAAAAGAGADHHAPQHDRLGLLARVRREAGDDLLRDLALDQLLDVAQKAVLV